MKEIIIFGCGVIVGATVVAIQRDKPIIFPKRLGSLLQDLGVVASNGTAGEESDKASGDETQEKSDE